MNPAPAVDPLVRRAFEAGHREPWAYIIHRDGRWRAVYSAELPKKELRRDLGKDLVDGFEVTTVYSREEYVAVLGTLKMWRAP